MAKYQVKCDNPGLARTMYHRLTPKYQARNNPNFSTADISVEGPVLIIDERFLGMLEKLTNTYSSRFSKPRKVE